MNVTIDNGRIRAMIADPTAVASFPFLVTMRTGKKGCCGRGGTQQPDFENIKCAMAGLAAEKRAQLRQVLKLAPTDTVTVYYKQGSAVKTATL